MFRSVFTKYITVFMLIIVISFLIQISIISTLIGGYSNSSKELTLSRAADAVSDYIIDGLDSTRYHTLGQYVYGYRITIGRNVEMMMKYAGDMSIIITDYDGTVLYSIGADVPIIPSTPDDNLTGDIVIDPDIMSKTLNGSYAFEPNADGGMFEKVKYVYGTPFTSKNGMKGVVFTCSSDTKADELLDSLINSSIMSSLWVLLAALVAVYFISERVTSPIKSMSVAARSFASGDFDVRVPIVGHDEVSELAVAFNNMASSLANLEQMRSSFLANVSHDLRTPMTTISGFIDGILDGAIPQDKYEHYLRIVGSEVKRLSRLVNTLLDITRIEAGERKFNMTDFDICEMARQIIISMETRIEEKNLNVEFISTSDNLLVHADHDAIYQILYNLCDNGVKFSHENGHYRVSVSTYAKKVHVNVYNDGQGIPSADLPFVFDRFYKSDKSRGLDKTGTGLGLYIAKTIIDAHGEMIDVKSEYGKYCEFHFTLEPAK